jgi:plasmid stabilization system protein ParE
LAHIEVSAAAAEDIARLAITHSLPPDTRERLKRSIRALALFPRLGVALEGGGWDGFRFVLGAWRWMVIVYERVEAEDQVVIATVQDGRSSTAATSFRA